MSCKSAIYVANTTAAAGITSGSTLPLGTTIRRFGCAANLSGNGILLDERGYYDVDANITFTPSAAAIYTVQLLRDGVAVPGASASVSASARTTLPINALVRLQCCNSSSTLTLVITSDTAGTTVTLNNLAIVVEKM